MIIFRSKECIPHLLKSNHAHILNLSPPLNLTPFWFSNHVAYTMAKYGMSMCVLGMAKEFEDEGIAVNALWPQTAIATAAVEMLLGKDSANHSRKPDIMADAAYSILIKDPKKVTGNFFIDENVLANEGITDLVQYACNPANANNLTPDAFLDIAENAIGVQKRDVGGASAGSAASGGDKPIAGLFKKIESRLSESLVAKTKAVYHFEVKGEEAGTWFLDLKSGSGRCGKGDGGVQPDAVLKMEAKNFFDMFSGKLKPASAFMTGKLKISGDLQKAMKLEKLMGSLKEKI